MIQIQDLHKSFNGAEVLRGVDFEVRDGETMVIIGRSGGGKSVLLKHLCGLLRPDAGRVIVDGVDIRAAVGARTHADPEEVRCVVPGERRCLIR
jgi:phospholipid/cholesterol/gamma-HCH transport system ATP-binding protein